MKTCTAFWLIPEENTYKDIEDNTNALEVRYLWEKDFELLGSGFIKKINEKAIFLDFK